MDKNKTVALLIDADNISSKYIKTIISELTENYGVISVKRVYGDWTTDNLKPWKSVMLENSLTPIQQFSYTNHKNSTDSAMIIDAMDILYTKEIDVFCLATSDCDFTKIASRLRESGKTVVGMGESKTNKAFISACNEFKYVDVLLHNDDDLTSLESTASGKNSITPLKEIKDCIYDLVNAADDEVGLGGLKSSIKLKFADFDERNYGYSKFLTFISSFSEFVLTYSGSQNWVTIESSKSGNIDEIHSYLIKSIKSGKKYTSVEIQNLIAKKYKDFKLKTIGYSNMKAFFKSLKELSVDKNGNYFMKK